MNFVITYLWQNDLMQLLKVYHIRPLCNSLLNNSETPPAGREDTQWFPFLHWFSIWWDLKRNKLLWIVYLLVCHVPFPAQGAGFLLQCTKCSWQASLVQRCCEPKFCTQRVLEHLETANRILHLERETAHDRRTDKFFSLSTLSGTNLSFLK